MVNDWRPKRTDQVYWQFSDNVIVLKDSETGWFYQLNDVGTLIWELVDGAHTIDDIVREVLSEYDVTPEQAHADVMEFLENLRDLNFLE